jgi:hypothetical protein
LVHRFGANNNLNPLTKQRVKKAQSKSNFKGKKMATKAYQSKKYVDIEQMLNDSEEDVGSPRKGFQKGSHTKNLEDLEEELDNVMPLEKGRKASW